MFTNSQRKRSYLPGQHLIFRLQICIHLVSSCALIKLSSILSPLKVRVSMYVYKYTYISVCVHACIYLCV